MAQYSVTGVCGHNTHVNLLGPIKGRYSKMTWMETKPCTACWLRSQGKLGAAAAQARASGEEKLAAEIIREARGERLAAPAPAVALPVPEISGPISNAQLVELGL